MGKTEKKKKRLTKQEKERLLKRRRRICVLTALLITGLVMGVLLLLLSPSEQGSETKTYPMLYREEIERCAAENNLESAYVASVVLAESSYNPEAVSSVGAQGLMQIMPETGRWIAGKLGETYEEGCLFDPETNLRYGCWYLSYLMNRYGGEKSVSSAAYHSGQGTVDGWLKNPEYSKDGVTLEVIPGDNARSYVGRILEYYEAYTEQYC